MHGAKAIMAAEPPSRQDLRQRPAIIVESPLETKTDGHTAEDANENRKTKAERQKKSVSPFPSPSDPSHSLKQMSLKGSKESLSSAEHDTYL